VTLLLLLLLLALSLQVPSVVSLVPWADANALLLLPGLIQVPRQQPQHQ
jgi:hypothetical protein